jgi:hypothetical protein
VRASLRDWPVPVDVTRFAEGRVALHREEKIVTLRPNSRRGMNATYEVLPAAGDAAGDKERPSPPRKRITTKDGASRYPMTTLTFQLFFGREWPTGMFITVRPPS